MNKRETVPTLMDAIQQGEFENVNSMLADDFSRAVSEPIDQEVWLEMSTGLKTSFPDLDYDFNVIGAAGDVVRTTMQSRSQARCQSVCCLPDRTYPTS